MRFTNKFYLIIPIVLCGITLTTVYASCGSGTSSTTNPFCPPYQLQDSSNSNAVRVTVDSLGNVGIGTSPGNYKLDTFGDIHTNGNLYLDSASWVKNTGGFANTGIDFGYGTQITRVASDGHMKLSSQNNNFEFNGNLILPPNSWVKSSAGFADTGFDFGYGTQITRVASDGHMKLSSQNNNFEFTGNIGIGTPTPSQKLEVNGAIQVDGNIQEGSSQTLKIIPATNQAICIGTGC